MSINTAKELSALENSLFTSKRKLTKSKEGYEKFVLESSATYRVFRLFLIGFLLSSVIGAILLIIFSKSKLTLVFEIIISFFVLIFIISLIGFFGEKWGFFGIAFCIPIVAFFCFKVRSWVMSYLAGLVSSCENDLNVYQIKFDDAISRLLLPQIHLLVMATTRDVMEKTSATLLREDTIIEILEKEVKSGAMTKVPLSDKKGVLYKSSKNSDMELCILEID